MNIVPPSDDKRQAPRSSFDGQALIRTADRATFMPCEPRNMSIGGMCLRLDEEVELQSDVEVQLVSGDSPHTIQCHGRVNWTTARLDVRAQPPIPYDVGIEFVGLSPQLRAELKRIIDAMRTRAVHAAP